MKNSMYFIGLGLMFILCPLQAAIITINTAELITPSADDGLCTLSEAVHAANTNLSSGDVMGECLAGEAHPVIDVIEFDASILPALFFTTSELTLTDSVHINGPAKELVVFSGLALNRVFTFFNLTNDASFKVTDVTFRDNSIFAPAETYGAAVFATLFNGATLDIKRVNFINNRAERGGGALALFGSPNDQNSTLIEDSYFMGNTTNTNENDEVGGGAIFIGARQNVTINSSTFSHNNALNFFSNQPLSDAAGGAILMRANGAGFESTLTIEQSTFSNNAADGVGGAIAMGGPGFPDDRSIVTIKHSTITENTADFNNDQPASDRGGGGIYSSSSTAINLFNSIVANNTDNSASPAAELAGAIISNGYNLIGNNQNASFAFPAGQPNLNNDWVGGGPAIIFPQLSTLDDFGGPTPTMMPSINSLAIDNGKCNVLTTDQRHNHNPGTGLRSFDDPAVTNSLTGCDIGAVERTTSPENPVPVANHDTYSLLEGETVSIDISQGLLGNDVDDNNLWVISAGIIAVLDENNVEVGTLTLMADGAFIYQPIDADYFGSFSMDYIITDRINRDDSAMLTLDLLPVNDRPELIAHDGDIIGLPGEFTTVPWAAFFSSGPANEADQSLTFLIDDSAVPAGFFSEFPSVDASNGELSFEVAEGMSGSAEIYISLRDDGGTANGGQDSNGPLTQIIRVSDVIFADGFQTVEANE